MCDEWLKVNPPAGAVPKQHQLFGAPEPLPTRGAPASTPPRAATPTTPPSPRPNPSPDASRAVHCLSAADIASFKALGFEVRFASEELGEVWLVPAYTGADRVELSVEHAMLLAAVGSVFPGAKVTSFGRREKS